MSFELVNTLATFGTFLVIAGTAIAALVQLRHARGSNQIAALDELREAFQSREFADAQAFVDTRLDELMKNPAFRYQWANRAARSEEFLAQIQCIRLVGNYFEDVGALILAGLLDPDLAIPIYGTDVVRAWDRLEHLTAIGRRRGGNAIWENFEYAAMLCKTWMNSNPEGGYPRNAPRLPVGDVWLEADREYTASLAGVTSRLSVLPRRLDLRTTPRLPLRALQSRLRLAFRATQP